MSSRFVRLFCVVALTTLLLSVPAPASAIPGIDCKEAPTPEMPGRGITGFFAGPPETLPAEEDPFAEDAQTTIFEQYGYAGLRWHTYDLGCGPDAMRHPDAVIGTSISNWAMQVPLALTALTGSVTQVAFAPDFLSGLDGAVEDVSTNLHRNLFVSWIPFVIAAIGLLILVKARRASLATSAGAVGWAVIVLLVATALFRWPVEAGRAADATVTNTLGAVVSEVDGNDSSVDPGVAVASSVNESILFRAWLAGTFGSPDSATAQKYGPALFKAQALTWREARIVETNPVAGEVLIKDKQDEWKEIADKIQDEDPAAYEYLTGERAETRLGYALLSSVGTLLALPFLLLSALLLLGCFLIVRLAVMLFPAFAILGAFPATRGVVTGLGRTVGAAVVNAIIFGVGAGVTIATLGLLFNPSGGSPAWLGLVLMPLFSLIMWVALKPFRRLTTMVSPRQESFGNVEPPRWAKHATSAALGAVSGGAGAAVATAAVTERRDQADSPERAEARPTPGPGPSASTDHGAGPSMPPEHVVTRSQEAASTASTESSSPTSDPRCHEQAPASLSEGFVPVPSNDSLDPAEPEEFEGDDVYVIYRPSDDHATSV
jgi:hypothetical protein